MTVQLRNLISYVTDEPDTYEKNKPYYILKANGVYRHTLRDAVLVKELYSGLDKDLPLLPKGVEDFEYVLPKIPFKIYLMILDFYKAVYDQSHTEASCHVFYLGDANLEIPAEYNRYQVGVLQVDDWLVYCPQQTNHGTLTSFREDELYPYLRKNYRLAIETHSHHKMDAFWSGTDNANQKDPVLYGVFGKIGTKDDFLVKYVHEATNIKIESDVIIDYPQVVQQLAGDYSELIPTSPVKTVYKGVFKSLNEFPQEWLTKCHKVSKKSAASYEYLQESEKTLPTGMFPKEHQRAEFEADRAKEVASDATSVKPVGESAGSRVQRFFHQSPLNRATTGENPKEKIEEIPKGKTEDDKPEKPKGIYYS